MAHKSIRKQSILSNYKYLIVDESAKHSWYLKDEEAVQQALENGEIGDGDAIIEITKENLRVAEKQEYIELL